jgi:multicomponent Na+:H+ antiporter subunit G
MLTGEVVAVVGALFLFLGALGVFRMPDLYNRMQSGTKATTLGNILTLAGLGIMRPDWLPRILLIAVFVMLTNPISSHALARAAHRDGIPLTEGSVRDDLAEHEGRSAGGPGARDPREKRDRRKEERA